MKVISESIEVAGYRIIPVPITHSLKVKSVAYLIEKDNKRIFYTGDIASINEKYFKRSKNLDLIITEASFLRKGGLIRKNKQGKIFGHNGVPDLVNLFEKFTSTNCLYSFWYMVPKGYFIRNSKDKIHGKERSQTGDCY